MNSFVRIFTCLVLTLLAGFSALAQCSVCTKTALQLGEKPAQGLNQGILYLMFMPFIIVGYIAYRWWKGQKELEQDS